MQQKMLDLAKKAQKLAHAPYSKFRVGACILSDQQRLYIGCNIENAAYPQGCCAEMAAIAHMIISGDRYIKEILVLGDGDKMCTPCGGCRQKIREFSDPYTMIHVANSFGILKSFTLEELLPYSFGPESIVCTK